MAKKSKRYGYNLKFLIGPAVAYGCYVLLLITALLKQHSGSGYVSFMFLTFWGVIAFLIALLLSLLGFVANTRLRSRLYVVNLALSLVLVIMSFSAMYVMYKGPVASYSCQDFVRCINY